MRYSSAKEIIDNAKYNVVRLKYGVSTFMFVIVDKKNSKSTVLSENDFDKILAKQFDNELNEDNFKETLNDLIKKHPLPADGGFSNKNGLAEDRRWLMDFYY